MECDASNMDVTTEVLLCLHQMEGKVGKHKKKLLEVPCITTTHHTFLHESDMD